MKFPLQIQFRDIAKSDFIYNRIWEHADKLERFYDRIVSCHVVVAAPHQQHLGKIYHVQIRIYLPGGVVLVTSEAEKDHAHEDVYVAIRDAFDAGRRGLEDFIRKQRGQVKERVWQQEVTTVKADG